MTATPARALGTPFLRVNSGGLCLTARTCACAMCEGTDTELQETPAVRTLRKRLWSWGWLSWWTQTILSVIAAVILLFVNSVSQQSLNLPALAGRSLAFVALAGSVVSNFWTWGYTRLSKRLGRKLPTAADAAARVSGSLRVGVVVNLLGICFAILGAEAIVGTLAAKAFTTQGQLALGGVASPVQAIDVLVVQANTNTLAAHFAALIASMRLQLAANACAATETA
uniref:DUF3611 family protein n=1 Tax=Calcidiscus leptoporus TaxID=127549 RepID=A0A7S0ITD5_9EUKA|eukprot:CAMPEP_0119372204 /NCGR_PEP_ID=MMETSP1334-20130426/18224_1 /TAXON_ID=127549 /ORGANISM="Calcidiscus leptoporus, Strain RCC1130" /LENGTH=225 /DNA_ID=CAMNT_0007389631 /DNA_START=35 /DNA_END=712 /DNA_ORIENTATION=+